MWVRLRFVAAFHISVILFQALCTLFCSYLIISVCVCVYLESINKYSSLPTQVVYKTNDDQVTVIGAGVTLHEALAAAEQLKKERINIRVIDPFTIKPLDSKTIIDNARATRGRIITVEDHYYEGGLGEAVCSAVVNETGFTVHRLAVSQVPRSGKPNELLRIFGIDRDAITQAVRKVLSSSANAK
ncbi:Transketolase [Liparis tanakae]|uniref:transketolase n=1 Tax=Liparis tanakae TaxID=230148 RepID=A0A4Z2H3A3_9TELE|nr:Transketolase [Liparis tanakae]